MGSSSLHGLYLILDARWSEKVSLRHVLEIALDCGVNLFQYRNKAGSMLESYEEALPLRKAATEAHAVFIVNDRCDLALAINADGVHLGQNDLPLDLARRVMGPDKLIGISTHRPEEVEAATRGGADYLGFGPIFPTTTKADHEPTVGIDGLSQIRRITSLPVFAIGGITVEAVSDIQFVGANGVAVASAVLDSANIEPIIKKFLAYFLPGP